MKTFKYLALAIVLVSSCKNKTQDEPLSTDIVSNPASANGGDVKDLPVITFKEDHVDFGKIKAGEIFKHDFTFTNEGKSDLIIGDAAGSCGCTIPSYPKEPIAPGKNGVIHVEFNSSGKSGHQEKKVTIVSNTIPNSKVLILTGEVEKK